MFTETVEKKVTRISSVQGDGTLCPPWGHEASALDALIVHIKE